VSEGATLYSYVLNTNYCTVLLLLYYTPVLLLPHLGPEEHIPLRSRQDKLTRQVVCEVRVSEALLGGLMECNGRGEW
jgi:hypothetical protein